MFDETLDSIKDKQALYSWFASLYLQASTSKLLEPFSSPKTMNFLKAFFKDEPQQTALRELVACINKSSEGDLKNEYDSLFIVPSKRICVPPYESCFREKKGSDIGNLWGETTADVAKFYRKAGYEVKNLQGVFAPDHIGVELAFIAKLCADKLQYMKNHDSEQTRRVEELRNSFLTEHIGTWIEDFSKAIDASSSSAFYKHLTQLTVHLVHSDLKNP